MFSSGENNTIRSAIGVRLSLPGPGGGWWGGHSESESGPVAAGVALGAQLEQYHWHGASVPVWPRAGRPPGAQAECFSHQAQCHILIICFSHQSQCYIYLPHMLLSSVAYTYHMPNT